MILFPFKENYKTASLTNPPRITEKEPQQGGEGSTLRKGGLGSVSENPACRGGGIPTAESLFLQVEGHWEG